MLTNRGEVASDEKIISDNLTHRPSVANSVWNNLSLGVATAPYAINSFDKEYSESPRGKTAQATYEAIKRGNENPEVGWVQWGTNEIANMVGQSLNPVTFLLAEAGGLAAKPISKALGYIAPSITRKPITELLKEPLAKYIPKVIGSEADKQTLSMGLIGQEWAKGFGIGAGVALPQATIDNFNAETGVHDIKGMATSLGAGGVFGMAVGTIPFAWGILKANVNRLRGRAGNTPITPDEINKMVDEGAIDKDTAQFMHDMNMSVTPEGRANARKYQERANKYVEEQGHNVDHANDTAQFEILNRDQINNLQSATIDQLVADHIPEEHRTALSDFTVQAGIDEMRNKPNLLDGVRGYVEHADKRLGEKEAILGAADRLVGEHVSMPHGALPFDQQSLLDIALKHGTKDQLPFALPREVKERLEVEKKIDVLERKNKKLFDEYERTGNSKLTKAMQENNKKVEDIRGSLTPLKSAMEELKSIKDELLPLEEGFKSTPEYHRLQDLADVWHPAKTLLDRVHLEDDINRQAAYRDLAKSMLDIADNNMAAAADSGKVTNYLQERIKQKIEDHSPFANREQIDRSVPADADVILAEQDRMMESIEHEEVREEYEKAKEKFQEFKKSEGIFQSLINCVLGSQ